MFELAQDLLRDIVNVGGHNNVAVPSQELRPAQLLDRIAATERLIDALLADQARDMATLAEARVAADKAEGLPDPMQGRTIGTEIGLALGVAPLTAEVRVTYAALAVDDYPELLGLLGTGRVSMCGLRLAIKETGVLTPEQRRAVDLQLADDVTRARHTPGMLARAAARRAQAADAEAAAKRAAVERTNRRLLIRNEADGTAQIWARLRAEEALALHNSLDSRARGMRADGDERSLQDLM